MRWKALDELESMCRSVVLETVVFVPETADQTRAFLSRNDTDRMEIHYASLFEELRAVCVVELSVIVEWVGWACMVVLVGF